MSSFINANDHTRKYLATIKADTGDVQHAFHASFADSFTDKVEIDATFLDKIATAAMNNILNHESGRPEYGCHSLKVLYASDDFAGVEEKQTQLKAAERKDKIHEYAFQYQEKTFSFSVIPLKERSIMVTIASDFSVCVKEIKSREALQDEMIKFANKQKQPPSPFTSLDQIVTNEEIWTSYTYGKRDSSEHTAAKEIDELRQKLQSPSIDKILETPLYQRFCSFFRYTLGPQEIKHEDMQMLLNAYPEEAIFSLKFIKQLQKLQEIHKTIEKNCTPLNLLDFFDILPLEHQEDIKYFLQALESYLNSLYPEEDQLTFASDWVNSLETSDLKTNIKKLLKDDFKKYLPNELAISHDLGKIKGMVDCISYEHIFDSYAELDKTLVLQFFKRKIEQVEKIVHKYRPDCAFGKNCYTHLYELFKKDEPYETIYDKVLQTQLKEILPSIQSNELYQILKSLNEDAYKDANEAYKRRFEDYDLLLEALDTLVTRDEEYLLISDTSDGEEKTFPEQNMNTIQSMPTDMEMTSIRAKNKQA